MNKIRLISVLVFICLTLIFVLGQLDTYNTIAKETVNKAKYLNNIFASAVHAKFHVVELTMEKLGDRLLCQNFYLNPSIIKQVLSKTQKTSESTVGYGFISPDGHYIAFSSNLDFHNIQKFSKYKDIKTILKNTSKAESVFFGRVYFMKNIQKWILPVYKKIQKTDGSIIGTLATGIDIDSFSDMMQGNLDIQDINTLILNNSGHWRVHIFPLDNDKYEDAYSKPLPIDVVKQAQKDLFKNYKMTPQEFRKSNNSYIYYTKSEIRGRMTSIDAARFLKRYNLIAITSIPEKSITTAFIAQGFYIKLIGFIITMLILGGLFIWALRKEEATRKKLAYLAIHDSLTGLYNREAYTAISKQWTQPSSPPFAIVFLDLDNFKNINDTFGHTTGDLILQEVSNRILQCVPIGSEVVRNGGDEFTILIHETELDTITRIVSQLLEYIAEPYFISGMHLHLGASAGVSFFPDDGMGLEQLMVNADLAMYQAKKQRNSFSFYNEELKKVMDRKTKIEHYLRTALDKNELHMVYQPQIDRTGTIHGIEALVRWQNPELGFVPPDQFIGVAEESALMEDLGNFILEQSLSDFAQLAQTFGELHFSISINISIKQFLASGFEEMLINTIEKHGIDKNRVTIEVTETLFIDDIEHFLPLLHSLNNHQITISLDDFGTGYSSLSMLRGLPIKELKVDRSFIANITNITKDANLIRSIINMGHTMNMVIVAEGVEEPEQLAVLKEYGCDIYQGYFYSRPLKFADLVAFFEEFK